MKILITVILVFVIIRIVLRFLFPFFIKAFIKKAGANFQQFSNMHPPQENTKPEGEISLENIKASKNKKNDADDYVDFEEVK